MRGVRWSGWRRGLRIGRLGWDRRGGLLKGQLKRAPSMNGCVFGIGCAIRCGDFWRL